MKPHISIITLGVSNLKKSSNFYQQLGFPVELSENISFIKMPGVWLALYGYEALAEDSGMNLSPKAAFAGFTIAHNVTSPAQVDKVMAEVRNLGATVTDEPHHRPWGGYSGYFQDLDGYLWEVAYNPYSPEIAVDEDA